MKKMAIIICIILGFVMIIFSTNLGIFLANINIDGTTEMQYCTYIDNYSASIRIIGLMITLFPVFNICFFKFN